MGVSRTVAARCLTVVTVALSVLTFQAPAASASPSMAVFTPGSASVGYEVTLPVGVQISVSGYCDAAADHMVGGVAADFTTGIATWNVPVRADGTWGPLTFTVPADMPLTSVLAAGFNCYDGSELLTSEYRYPIYLRANTATGTLDVALSVQDFALASDPSTSAYVQLNVETHRNGALSGGVAVTKFREGGVAYFNTPSSGRLRLVEPVVGDPQVQVNATAGGLFDTASMALYNRSTTRVCDFEGRPGRLNSFRNLLSMVGINAPTATIQGWVEAAQLLTDRIPQAYRTRLVGETITNPGLTPLYALTIAVTDATTGNVVSRSSLYSRHASLHDALYGLNGGPLAQVAASFSCRNSGGLA